MAFLCLSRSFFLITLFSLSLSCSLAKENGAAQNGAIPSSSSSSLTPNYSIQDFFRKPEKTRFKISPDVKYIAYMAPYEKRLNIFVQKSGEKNAVRLTSETARDIKGYSWKDKEILYLKDANGDENYKLYSISVENSHLSSPRTLVDIPKVRVEFISSLTNIPNEILISHNQRDPKVFDVYKLNVKTGIIKLIAKNPGNISSWLADHNGKLRLATASDGVNTSILYRQSEEDEFKTVLKTNFKESLSPILFTFDNKNIYALSAIPPKNQGICNLILTVS